jgi:hypothetical protein
MLGAYMLLLAAAAMCIVLGTTTSARMHHGPGPELSSTVRALYTIAWLVPPLMTRDLDWSAYATIPLGVCGLLGVRNLATCWCCDPFALVLLLAPFASISLAYTVDLADSKLATGLLVERWQQTQADAYYFDNGFVIGEWAERTAIYSQETGTFTRERENECASSAFSPHTPRPPLLLDAGCPAPNPPPLVPAHHLCLCVAYTPTPTPTLQVRCRPRRLQQQLPLFDGSGRW